MGKMLLMALAMCNQYLINYEEKFTSFDFAAAVCPHRAGAARGVLPFSALGHPSCRVQPAQDPYRGRCYVQIALHVICVLQLAAWIE